MPIKNAAGSVPAPISPSQAMMYGAGLSWCELQLFLDMHEMDMFHGLDLAIQLARYADCFMKPFVCFCAMLLWICSRLIAIAPASVDLVHFLSESPLYGKFCNRKVD